MILLALMLAAQAPATPPQLPPRPDYPSWAQPVPHVLNPLVTPDTLKTTVCSKAKDANGFTWTHNQRPPTAYTNKIKFELMEKAGIPRSQSSLLELDHISSIEDGGSPTDPRNLRLQPWTGHFNARTKDKLETHLAHDLCAGKRTLDEVQSMLADDWPKAYREVFGADPQ